MRRVISKNSIEPSRGPMIVAEESSKSLAARDGAVSTRWCEAFWRNQPILKTLMIPFPVIMRRECGERSAQAGFAEDDDPVQALLFNRPHEALRNALQLGACNGVCPMRTAAPASAKVRRNVALHLVSRGHQMRMRDLLSMTSRHLAFPTFGLGRSRISSGRNLSRPSGTARGQLSRTMPAREQAFTAGPTAFCRAG
jgi:hypothetical protein